MHNNDNRDLLIAWLKDAHAMERALVATLEGHAKDAMAHPKLRSRIEQHVQETRMHAEMTERCLEQLGAKPSAIKNTMGKMAGAMQGAAPGAFDDAAIKNLLSDIAAEHFEMAAYRCLREAAHALEEHDIAHTCDAIVRDEEDMARFLESHLAEVTREFLAVAA